MTEYVVELTDKQTADLRKVRRERIVRCRDCSHGDPFCGCSSYPGKINCLHFAQWDYYDDEPGVCPVEPDGFCAWGRERED